jgi:hypothetical protein
MEWTGDVTRGSWIGPRLRGWGTVNSTAPAGFGAYARIFHPFHAGRATVDIEVEWTWAELARRTGRTMHPLAQAANLLGSDGATTVGDWEVGFPEFGLLQPESLAALIDPLRAATSTPDDVTIGIWDGWGELNTSGGSVFGWFPADDPPEVAAAAQEAMEREFREQRVAAVDPDVAKAVNSGSLGEGHRLLLQLPGRDYALLATTLDELADPDWPYSAGIGWRREYTRFGAAGPMPQLIWPADQAWCVASEIDFDSTVVGGSRTLIDAVLSSGLEALAVPEDGDLTENGDRINPGPTAAPSSSAGNK